jgi:signal transduction histidine kinase
MQPVQQPSVLILVVDDDEIARSCLRLQLQQSGYSVIEAETAKRCQELLEVQRPNIVILDADLPEISGCGCYQQIQAITNSADVQAAPAVIMLTDHMEQLAVDQMLASGATDVLTKPVQLQLLQQHIRQLLRTQAIEAALRQQIEQLLSTQVQVQELQAANCLKDEFVCTVIHELRAPMTNGKVAFQLLANIVHQLKQELYDHPAASKLLNQTDPYLQILQVECNRMSNLIDDLLDLQYLETGKYPLDLEPIDLYTWIPRLVEPYQTRANQRQQTLTIQLPPNLPQFTASIHSLERVLCELLNNACKYTPPEATIQLTAQADSGNLQLIVSNSGVEIPDNQRHRIFERFYRIPGSDIWKQGGTGLGLALVRRLVTHLGGTIEIQSSSGQVAFVVELPIVQP